MICQMGDKRQGKNARLGKFWGYLLLFFLEVAFEQRPEGSEGGSHGDVWGKGILG